MLEITKLTGEDAKEKNKRIDIDELSSCNLVFVDEGHKGSSGEEWMKNWDAIAKDGFAFEYRATFGQAIKSDNRGLLASYGKAILFDYHYRYFYRDGYGKDYQILNVDAPSNKYNDNIRDRVFLANLLAFYERLRIYDDYKDGEVKSFYIEHPLWIFVGSKVTGEKSDIVTILRFLQKVLMERTWAIRLFNPSLKENLN